MDKSPNVSLIHDACIHSLIECQQNIGRNCWVMEHNTKRHNRNMLLRILGLQADVHCLFSGASGQHLFEQLDERQRAISS